MAHLVTPTSFRTGKTQPWSNNVILNSKKTIINSDLSNARAFEKISKALLLRKRLYVVKTNVSNKYLNILNYKLLFVPRIKIKTKVHSIGNFIRKSLYKPVNLKINKSFKNYVDLRKDKAAKIRKNKKPKKLNRWLSRRIFRGSARKILLQKNFVEIVHRKPLNTFFPETVRKISPFFTRDAKTIKFEKMLTIYKKYYARIQKRQLWKFDHMPIRRFDYRKFSYVLAKIVNRPLKIGCENLFSYLLQKKVLNFKTHQNHFWNYRYRRYRFHYKNYYDIINSFLFISIIDNTESFFLSILKITLPLIIKIRKFFKFLSIVIKYLPEIEKKFLVFKLSIAGKLAGGTKRTKFHSIGYGVLPIQSLSVNAVNNFLAYTHIYGEFGVKLIMCKRGYALKSFSALL